jgi:hypothetical protein
MIEADGSSSQMRSTCCDIRPADGSGNGGSTEVGEEHDNDGCCNDEMTHESVPLCVFVKCVDCAGIGGGHG